MKAYDLRCEHLHNPIGIDTEPVHLSWKCTEGIWQKAYEIRAALNIESADWIWNSGEVVSGQMYGIIYPYQLHTGQRVYWQVRVMDENGTWGMWSETALFEMGLLAEEDKAAEWINPEESYDRTTEPPVSLIRKEFKTEKKCVRARLYISSLGNYEAGINGKRVGDQILTPGFTDMMRRRQYQTYDVTDMIRIGNNAIGVSLADGWARGRLGFVGQRNQFTTEIALWAQLVITYSDGNKDIIITDGDWRTSKYGPVRMSDMRDGEVYDARMEQKGWMDACFDDRDWDYVKKTKFDGKLEGTRGVPVKELMRLKGELLATPDGRKVIDFKQNIAGYVEFRVQGKTGDRVHLVHGEELDKAGNFTMRNFQFESSPETPIYNLKQEITYILSGEGTETYKPHFIYMGFRYLLIDEWPGEIEPEDFTAVVVGSEMVRIGTFQCSNKMLNRFYSNSIWSQRSNFIDIPTDCPHRERMGWTGDAHIFARTASTNFDTQAFFGKWLADVRSTQTGCGQIRNTVPCGDMEGEVHMEEPPCSSGWGDAITIIPYRLYEIYGDMQLLLENYPAMKKWVEYELGEAASTNNNPSNPYDCYIWDSGFHWGEWLEPSGRDSRNDAQIDKAETATAYMAYSVRIVSEIAKILGFQEDSDHYSYLAEQIRKAYIYTFTEEGIVNAGDRQCKYVRPLAFDLLPEDKRQANCDKLNEILIRNEYHVGTGFLSTPYLCEVLTKGGHINTAYRTLLNTSFPSWLYPVTKGATTIWELWDGYDESGEPIASHNHYAFGSVIEWVYRYMVGIDTYQDYPAYERFRIKPYPNNSITFAEARIDTIRGTVACSWKMKEDRFCISFTVPACSRADVILPGFVSKIVKADGLSFTEGVNGLQAEALPGSYEICAAI